MSHELQVIVLPVTCFLLSPVFCLDCFLPVFWATLPSLR